ncbi:DNA-3-methyladenine glycosylase family protein [Paracoccus chinensis]|uniref:DNA-3-methyladenine glycosylase II n=1 Tax=Paracoccus chinensis TaxID=525640 RepID=A0A1G9DTN4_9RHOB|nr:DNA-3-methyladenine glycosylase [Paracoccus chinensis]SDK67202.1 DNA-3-methyladenine glycosylase II [Paracoccus chinensis]
MSLRVIASDADLAEGAAHLASVCPVWAQVLPQLGPLPLRRRADGFGALMSAIVSQQISTAAAASISARLAAAGLDVPGTIMAADDAALRACGLSGQKVRYLRALAEAGIDFDALRLMPDEEVSATLTALPGIGRWTAEMYLIFALGRADTFAPDDLALQEAARLMYGLAERPKGRALAELARPWAPWRAVAARGLWAYYHVAKGREGVT